MTYSTLVFPYGGKLVDLRVPPDVIEELKVQASHLLSVQMSDRSLCELELLATGTFSPLDRFMGREDHQRVVEEIRLANGNIFPIPITLPVEAGTDIRLDQHIALRDARKQVLAVMTVEEI